ncbi:MAG: PAS domain S-box protein, partial [Spirochaetales bacterium]|nr:PAS domain S-box protein [Spirochaetales bacterium]
IPIFAILLSSGYEEYRNILRRTDEQAWGLVHEFKVEQEKIVDQTQQFLKLLSQVPSIAHLEREEGNRFLQEIHEFYPQYSTIVAASPEGLIDICAIPLKKTINVQDRSWFQRVTTGGEFVIDHFLISRSAHKGSLPFAYPVFDEEGRLIAALGAAYDLEDYDNIFTRQNLPRDSLFYVADKDDQILYSGSSTSEGEGEVITGKPIGGIIGFDIPDEGKGFINRESESGMLYWFERLSVGEADNRITLVIGISSKVLFEDLRRKTRRNLGLFALTVCISLMSARIFGNRLIFSPIQALKEKTLRVKKGDFTVLKDRRSLPGELHHLSDAFDLMIENLAKREKERDLAEARLRILFEQASDAIYVSDWEGSLVQVNERACEDTGYSRSELLGMSIFDMDEDYNTPESFQHFLTTFSPGNPLTLETTHVRKDGTAYPVELTVGQLDTQEGMRIMGIARDITERKRLLEEVNHAEKLKSIGQLAGGIAHDFNNQLAGIFGYVDLLQMDLEEGTSPWEMVDQISKIAQQAKDLPSQLLAFSRKGKNIHKPIDVNALINDVVLILESSIDKKIKLNFHPGDFYQTIAGDPSQLHNVFLNIALNARDSMTDGGELTIGSSIEDLSEDTLKAKGLSFEPGRYIEVTMGDTGQGMTREVLNRAIEPFYTTKPLGKGTGMGLSAAFGAMKAHGGELKIESEPNVGTVVSLYFPAIEEEVEAHSKGTGESKNITATGTVLLVDDNRVICRTESALLSSLGFTVQKFISPSRALEYFEKNYEAISLVIIDMIMPDMNGAELFEELIKIDGTVKVLLSSGFSLEGGTQELLDRGVKGFLQKPFTLKELSEKIESLKI